MNESTEADINIQVLVQEVEDGAWNSALLTSSQMILNLLVRKPLSE